MPRRAPVVVSVPGFCGSGQQVSEGDGGGVDDVGGGDRAAVGCASCGSSVDGGGHCSGVGASVPAAMRVPAMPASTSPEPAVAIHAGPVSWA